MTDKYLTVAFETDASPQAAFEAINNVRGWWSQELEGETENVGDVFTYTYADIHRSTQKVTELVPGEKVAWHVVEGYLNFTADPAEWTGTDVVFDIRRAGDKTHVRLTHVGLTPDIECFVACSQGWGYYAGVSLPALIARGVGDPNEVGAVRA
jgi:hypothetical protein